MILSEPEKKIIQAATEVFLQKGKNGARMQEIADLAGINKALLHYYFRSKDRLYDRVFETTLESFFDEFLDAILKTDGPGQFLKGFIDNYIDALSRRPEVIRFIMWEIGQGGSHFSKVAQAIFAKRGFSEIPFPAKIQQAINKGEIRALDPVQLMFSVIGMCLYPFIAQPIIEKMFSGVQVDSAVFLEDRKKEIFELIWDGIKPVN